MHIQIPMVNILLKVKNDLLIFQEIRIFVLQQHHSSFIGMRESYETVTKVLSVIFFPDLKQFC